MAVDGSGESPLDNGATVSEAETMRPAPSAIRVRRLEAELRAERRHAATTEEHLKHAQASLQQALVQLEERRVAVVELQTVLQATEPRLITLERALAERAADTQSARHEADRAAAALRELEQQHELLRAAANVREDLVRELTGLRAAHARVNAELDALRSAHARLATRLRELEAAHAPPPSPAPPEPEPPCPPATPGSEEDGAAPGAATGPLTVVHIEDQPAGRDAVRAAVGRQPGTRYVCPQFPPAGTIRSATLLAVNLLCRHLDPLAVIADARKWGVPEPRAFTYCSDGARNLVLGLIEYFPFPFDPEACAARLFARQQGTRRILTVGNHIELMTRLRTVLSSGRCSTTVAVDGRQALDLVKPVNPEVILIDLALPRGDGLDVLTRLRADPATAAIPVAFLWTQKLGSGIFRQYASRVLQDWRGDGVGVAPALVKLLSTLRPGGEATLSRAD